MNFDLGNGMKPARPPSLFEGLIPASEYARVLPVEDAALLEKFEV